jgi:hypothetical protein
MFFHRLIKKFTPIEKRTSFSNGARGSFLLEALIAVSILSVSLVIVIRSHVAALQAQIFAKDYTLATLLLENEMIQVIERGVIDRDMNATRNLEKPYERFTFSLRTEAAGKEYVFEGLNQAQLTLSWKEGNKPHKLSASTLVTNSL